MLSKEDSFVKDYSLFFVLNLKAFHILARCEGLLVLFVVITFCSNAVVFLFLSVDDDEG